MKLLASAASLEQIQKIISDYYFSHNIELKETDQNRYDIHNLRGKIDGVMVIKLKNRYRFERV
ncbi:MAG: hypothetical protein ACOC22_03465 [bacterium]